MATKKSDTKKVEKKPTKKVEAKKPTEEIVFGDEAESEEDEEEDEDESKDETSEEESSENETEAAAEDDDAEVISPKAQIKACADTIVNSLIKIGQASHNLEEFVFTISSPEDGEFEVNFTVMRDPKAFISTIYEALIAGVPKEDRKKFFVKVGRLASKVDLQIDVAYEIARALAFFMDNDAAEKFAKLLGYLNKVEALADPSFTLLVHSFIPETLAKIQAEAKENSDKLTLHADKP